MEYNQSSNKNTHAINHQSKKRAMAQTKVQQYDLAAVLHDWRVDPNCSLAKAIKCIFKITSSEEERVYLNIAIVELGDWIYQYYEFLTPFGFPSTEPEVNYDSLP
ncbi:hypothetical protein IM40_08230 [Candidatus Paracaedimonas acanthamoebae]|nr:hypothetical protein IM40_08230 [Candidatus Paracaedimonas acanthamoebae]